MDIKRFTSSATGTLTKLSIKGYEWAFIPNRLPPAWEFPAELWPELAEAKAKLGELNGIGRTLPNPQLLLRPLQDRESLRSSSLEGTYATPADLLLFDKQPREPRSKHDPANAWKEVWNYGAALREGMAILKDRPLSTVLIKSMHHKLLTGVRGRDQSPGEFRRSQVHIGSDRRYVPPPASHVDDLMYDLQAYMNTDESQIDPLVRCFIVHYQFEAVHPFLDGNGRVGRALLSLMVMHQLGHYLPWLYLSAYFERYKDEYVDNMFAVSADGAWTEWIRFCLRGTIAQADDAIGRIESLKRLQAKYKRRLDMNRPRIHRIIDDLFTSPVLTKPELAKRLEVDYKTAASDIDHLVECEVLQVMPDTSHPKAYCAPQIIAIAFGETLDQPSEGSEPE